MSLTLVWLFLLVQTVLYTGSSSIDSKESTHCNTNNVNDAVFFNKDDSNAVHNFLAWACNQQFLDTARENHLYTLNDLEQMQQQRLIKLAHSQNLSRSDLQYLSKELIKIWQLVYTENNDKADQTEIANVKTLVWLFHVFRTVLTLVGIFGFTWIVCCCACYTARILGWILLCNQRHVP